MIKAWITAVVSRTDEWKMSHRQVIMPAQNECGLCPEAVWIPSARMVLQAKELF